MTCATFFTQMLASMVGSSIGWLVGASAYRLWLAWQAARRIHRWRSR